MLVTWNWNRLPACCVFCVGWLLLAANEHVRKHPSRWHQCPSYSELCYRIILNTATSESVSDNANLDEIIEYDKRIEQLQQRRVMEKLKEQEQELTLQRDLGQEIEAAKAAEKLGGNDGGIFSGLVKNPLMPVLYPIQQQLSQFVYSIRIAKSVVLWHEAFYSFWIVTGCFLLSAVFFWLPWGFLLRWLLRIIVFIGLGPWMAIVDRKYFKTNPDKDEELRHRLRARYDEVLLSATNYFQRKERAMKLLSMKKLMFGKHTLRVPRFCEDRYEDLPLPSSSCDPVDPDLSSLRVDQVKFCQNLKGDMIPKREIQVAVADMKKLSGKKTNWKSLQNLQAISPEKIPLLGYASDERVSCGYSSVATLKKTD